jgi:hypothetical protein
MSDVPPRLLRDALRRTAATPSSSSCIDAATLAAWADGSLPRGSRAALESHAASCERCQALIAAMARTAPPAAPRRRWLPAIGWLVPVAAAATALVLWIGVPERRPTQPAAAVKESAGTQVAPPAPQPAMASPAPAAGEARAQADAASTVQPMARQRARPETGSAAGRAEQSQAAGAGARESSPPAAAAVAAPFAAKDEGTAARVAQVDALRDVRADAPRATLNSAAARPAVQDAAKAAAAVEIVSPDTNVRWRINATNVERSGDAGTTWQMQSTGARAALASGAAPSRTVCWIVGAAGTVVRSIDGRTWQRLAFPESIDLRGVRASDEAHAIVTAADGRIFTTVDGGQTWQASGPR